MRLVGLFGVVALAELFIFVAVERQIGLLAALLIALGTAVLGSALVRRSGLAVWARIQEKVGQGAIPGKELSAGVSVLVAGALLISPGFLTDIVGFLLLVPSVQAGVHTQLAKRISSKIDFLAPGGGPDSAPTVIDVDSWEV
jgi:UPF0716 protein FxsA